MTVRGFVSQKAPKAPSVSADVAEAVINLGDALRSRKRVDLEIQALRASGLEIPIHVTHRAQLAAQSVRATQGILADLLLAGFYGS
jgi:hypothetical protein